MNRAEFQQLSEGVVDSGTLLQLHDVLELSHQACLHHQPSLRKRQKLTQKKLGGTITWLELTFFADMASDEMECYGIKVGCLDLESGKTLDTLPPISLDQDKGPGEPQELDWSVALGLMKQFNSNLPFPVAPPFVRIAFDEARANSLYYRLSVYDYKKFVFKKINKN